MFSASVVFALSFVFWLWLMREAMPSAIQFLDINSIVIKKVWAICVFWMVVFCSRCVRVCCLWFLITLYESFVFMISYSGGMSLGSIICIG